MVVCCSDHTWMKCSVVRTTRSRHPQCAAVKATVGGVRTSSNKYQQSGVSRGMHASVQELCIRVYTSA
jgi:hypothetical protein